MEEVAHSSTKLLVIKVSIPNTHRDHFDYFVDEVLPCIGSRVLVPFRKQMRLGLVIGLNESDVPHESTKSIAKILDDKPLLSGEILALCFWVSQYYQSPLSEVLTLALPKKYRTEEQVSLPTTTYYELKEGSAQNLPAQAIRQKALVAMIAQEPTLVPKSLITSKGFTSAQLQALVERGILTPHEKRVQPLIVEEECSPPLPLNDEQALAVDVISQSLGEYRCFLLQGVTGSGKTEVYLQVIAKVLAAGRQVLVLVPEIGLTPQLLSRFKKRFKVPIAVVHSHLNDTERQQAWQWACDEEVKLVIGTRAAIFTPMPNLGLIVIDEEHDASLKQMEGVRYFARDTALMRAHLRHVPIILGSATPSLESLHNCMLQKYTLLKLNQKAMQSVPLRYQLIDLRNQQLEEGLARPTLAIISEHLALSNQVLVFINRRGFAPVLLCHQCGWMADCRACDAHLIMHRGISRLVCHHCGLIQSIPKQCKQCNNNTLIPIGTGTERVYDYLKGVFPKVNILRIDRDEVRKKHALDASLERIHSGDAQLIVGTQMLAKGHHFPRLTLVVILDADNGFYNQDFRALERLGQLITQVAGRAGRAEFPGQVVIQTHLPQHPLLNVLVQQGYEDFAKELLFMRKLAEFPPYQFLTLVRAQGKKEDIVLDFLHGVKTQLKLRNLNVMGPAPAPLARKAGFHRMQLLVKSSSRKKLRAALTEVRDWLTISDHSKGVRWNMDVDPFDLS
jgi:primosomal protein N' (replication factor Y)